MKINKILLLASVLLMAAACQKDDTNSKPAPTPTPGMDVSFGGTLDQSAVTRTIYGDEVTEGTAWYFPILWLSTDKVFIASPQCREDVNQGTFGVQLPQESEEEPSNCTFVKESGGVQWGSTNADFYAFYPQRTGDYEIKTANGFSATNATFELNMPASQTCVVEATSDSPKMKTADMNACFGYAKSTNVANGTSPVNLEFDPISTAIRFTLQGPTSQGQTLSISRIRLIGPEGAALTGKFKVNLTGDEPVVTAAGDNSNIVTVYARYENQAYLQLAYGQSIELNAFIIPLSNMKVDENWKLEVALSNGKLVSKTLKPTSGANTNLIAGMIHRLGNMPKLPVDFDITKWLEFIPRNVYLSEISLPGSWNSLNSDFQTLSSGSTTEEISEATIDAQYALGCRAFHLDTRFRRIDATSTDFTNLGIANGGDTAEPLGGGGKKVMKRTACPLFSEALRYITDNVKPNEYMVVICTFAQNSYEGADWRQKVSDACANNTAVYDASEISANTTVKDVLGKVIVIVNCEGAVPTISGSKCLFVNAPLTLSASTFSGGYPSETLYKGNGTSGLSLNYVQAQVTSNTTGFDTGTGAPLSPIDRLGWNGENRGFAPNFTQRQTIGNNILTWSSQNVTSQNYQHKDWIFLGLGGYLVEPTTRWVVLDWEYQYTNWDTVSNSYTTVANNLNNWINGKVTAMDTNRSYYPVGIVLMNKVKESGAGWSSPNTIKNIVFLNNKFYKAFDPTKPEWPIQGTSVQSKAPGYSSGMVDNNAKAMGWE